MFKDNYKCYKIVFLNVSLVKSSKLLLLSLSSEPHSKIQPHHMLCHNQLLRPLLHISASYHRFSLANTCYRRSHNPPQKLCHSSPAWPLRHQVRLLRSQVRLCLPPQTPCSRLLTCLCPTSSPLSSTCPSLDIVTLTLSLLVNI